MHLEQLLLATEPSAILVGGFSGAALAIVLCRRLRHHKVARILLAFTLGTPSLAAMGLGALMWWRIWNPFMDMGPYLGNVRPDAPARPPDQTLAIYSGFVIESYDPQPEEAAPTVRLLTRDGTILWSILAVPSPQDENMPVMRIRFADSRSWPFQRPRVIGSVDWAMGNEACWWFVSTDGHLEEYWYSW